MMKTVTLTENRVREITEAVHNVRVCVVGDVCLDLYWYADMKRSRLSRETPHYPLPVVREVYSPGGCANVMANVRALEPKALLPVSFTGDDWRGMLLRRALSERDIPTEHILTAEKFCTPCYCKPMRMGISDVIYEDPRLDFENDVPVSPADEKRLIDALYAAARESDVIAVSDQLRCGVITPAVREALSSLARSMPVIVDSREKAGDYTGVIVKPNEVEAAAAIGRMLPDEPLSTEEYAEIGLALQKKNGCPVVVTLGERGALWCDADDAVLAPTVKAEPPVDIVGAGDTFLSAFSAAFGGGVSGPEALAFANLASGVTVKKLGTTGTASCEEILQKWENTYGT